MENSFEIPISRRDFMEMAGMEATEGIAANTAGEPENFPAAAGDRKNGTITYAGREIPVLY